MERWLTAVWYGRGGGGWLLRPLAGLFALLTAVRRLAYRRGWLQSVAVGAPVIVVGNLTVGGTGKTPLVLWLTGRLRSRGHSVAVVARGYGRSGTDVRVVAAGDVAESVGDEPLLLARRSGVPVVVGRDRVAAARRALELGATAIVADDGLQHLRLARDFEIAVVDGRRAFGNGRLLPAGPLREPVRRLESVDAVVVNGTAAPVMAATAVTETPGPRSRDSARASATASGHPPPLRLSMRLEAGSLRGLDGSGAVRSLEGLRGERVHAVAGIGEPERFFEMLRTAGVAVIPHPFPDHHRFTAHDLEFTPLLPIVMTEKDAVKCGVFGVRDGWYLPVQAEIEGGEELLARIEAVIGQPGGAGRGRREA